MRASHATTKFRWGYRYQDGTKETGAFVLPIGEEYLAKKWFKKIIETHLKNNEKFEWERGIIIEYGNEEGKIR